MTNEEADRMAVYAIAIMERDKEVERLKLKSEQYRFALMEARGVISKALLTAQVTE